MKEVKKTLTATLDFRLPEKLISQNPKKPRDQARLLILDPTAEKSADKKFFKLGDYLKKGDLIILNDSKVIPARLIGKKPTGGKLEVFLLKKISGRQWQCLLGGRTKVGQKITFSREISGVIQKKGFPESLIEFNAGQKRILAIGQTPTPPYIKKKIPLKDYQTVYAGRPGSLAAPTAGLHFSRRLIKKLKRQGIEFANITLEVGLGTFAPIRTKYLQNHQLHREFARLPAATARKINQTKKQGGRIIACGTTVVRTLEAFSSRTGQATAKNDWLEIFITPGYRFKLVEGLITNFHLPRSSLLALTGAFVGLDFLKEQYRRAIAKKYRFYSFGDAMLILPGCLLKKKIRINDSLCYNKRKTAYALANRRRFRLFS